jgi:hypothetical protein
MALWRSSTVLRGVYAGGGEVAEVFAELSLGMMWPLMISDCFDASMIYDCVYAYVERTNEWRGVLVFLYVWLRCSRQELRVSQPLGYIDACLREEDQELEFMSR